MTRPTATARGSQPLPATRSATRRAWVSLEGVNGVGKTYLAGRVARALGPRCQLLTELPDSSPDQLPGQIIAALHAGGDLFLRTGRPRTETLLLAALVVHRHEQATNPPGSRPGVRPRIDVVLEDRSVHSVAAYQAAILTTDDEHAHALARHILAAVAAWRPLPDATLLLRDDPDACLHRFCRRIGRPARPDELALMTRVDRLYTGLAVDDPDRVTVLDRRHADEQAVVDSIVLACRRAAETAGATANLSKEMPCAR
jgi:thymidylate kinase